MNKTSTKSLLLKLTSLVLVVALCLGLSSCFFLTNDEEAFDLLLDELFESVISGDYISTNILLEHPENYNLEMSPSDVTMYTPSASEEEYRSGYEGLASVVQYILQYNYSSLSDSQQKAYNVLVDYFSDLSKGDDFYYFEDSYLSSSSGYNSNLPIYLNMISFRTVNDVECYLALLAAVPDAFSEYVTYERARCSNCYGRADFILEGIVAQAESFAPEGQDANNFLIKNFNDKLAASGLNLSEAQMDDYRTRNYNAITTGLLPAYRTLAANIRTLIENYPTSTRNQLGLSHFNNGTTYYEYLFQKSTNTDDTVDEAYDLLNAYHTKILGEYRTLAAELTAANEDIGFLQTQIYNENDYSDENILSILNELRTDSAADFPAVAAANVNITHIDESLKDFYAPAAYFTSALDSTSTTENICVNPPDDVASGYVVFELLAHEGYPGHLFENSLTKTNGNAMVMSALGFSGWSEGWATYTQMYSWKYYDTVGSAKNKAYQLILLDTALLGIEEAMMDILVNYRGYDFDELKTWCSEHSAYVFSDANVQSFLEFVIESPTNSSMYYYCYVKFLELREAYKEKLGSSYTDKAFHTAVLETGAMPFDFVEYYLI